MTSIFGTPQQIGKAWEDVTLRECELLARAGRARVERRLPEMVSTGKDEKGYQKAYHVQGTQTLDFEGHLCVAPYRGRRLVFDTKSSSDAHAFRFDLIKDGQMERYIALAGDGVACFVYVLHINEQARRSVYLLPFDEAGRIAGRAHRALGDVVCAGDQRVASIKWKALDEEGWRCLPNETWLDAFLRLEKKNREAPPAQHDAVPGLEDFVLT